MALKLKGEWRELIGNALALLVGVYFIWQRDQALVHLVVLAALGTALTGVWEMIRWLISKPRPDAIRLAVPIFLVVVAIVVYCLRTQIIGIVPMLMGLAALMAGIVQMLIVLRCAKEKQPVWWLHAPSALLWLLFGVLVLTGAINLNSVFTLMAGILLAVFGAIGVGESIAIMHMR